MEAKNKIEIDLELYSKEGKNIPKGQKYKIKVDRDQYTIDQECLTGKEILELARKLPTDRFQLNQKLHGGKVTRIAYDQMVDFTQPGIEKFMTIPLDQTEGGY